MAACLATCLSCLFLRLTDYSHEYCLSIWFSDCLCHCLPGLLTARMSVSLTDCLPEWLYSCLPVGLPLWLSVCLSGWMSGDHLANCLSFQMIVLVPGQVPLWLSVCLNVCLADCLPVSLSQSVGVETQLHSYTCHFNSIFIIQSYDTFSDRSGCTEIRFCSHCCWIFKMWRGYG